MNISMLLGLDGRISDAEIMDKVDSACKNHLEEVEFFDRKGRKVMIRVPDIKYISGQFLT